MLKAGDKVRIIGSYYAKDFSEGVLQEDDIDGYPLVKFNNGSTFYVDDYHIFKENSWSYKIMKLFKRKKYAEYQRTHKKCNEV